ncbi:Rad9-domain-containing protein [Cantharellus anzutake]|uniref:Rad9-domain-containing protein n=1 Tax=Cantharellus anzutake TaxID=1750568 RepID=UPI001907327D|nr:Rad9-domain-containing protein [Cantharellus anzutake]KAF8323482.1 Rad9-domain-containing protein [Cantharellus anzutake]
MAVIPQFGIKPFSRALACLSKYSDDITICVRGARLTLSAVNSSKSAYGRIVFFPGFFDSYDVTAAIQVERDADNGDESAGGGDKIEGDVSVKPMLGIFRHRSVADAVDKCELVIRDPLVDMHEDTNTSISSVLLVRMHCKHGIIKTHRLSLKDPTSITPHIPDSSDPSRCRIVVGPQVVKDLLDHFSGIAKIDAQLEWHFEAVYVSVKTADRTTRKRQDAHIATEIRVDADDFDVYAIQDPPISLCFHLREFNAATALADSISLPINIVLMEPGKPISMEIQTEDQESLFLISTIPADFNPTSTVRGSGKVARSARKRKRVDEPGTEPRKNRPDGWNIPSQNDVSDRQSQPLVNRSGRGFLFSRVSKRRRIAYMKMI